MAGQDTLNSLGGAGSSDSLGPESLNGNGRLLGGRGGALRNVITNNNSAYGADTFGQDGGSLAGGGTIQATGAGVLTFIYGGWGGTGAGGGAAVNIANAAYTAGGRGGNGLVVFQYLS